MTARRPGRLPLSKGHRLFTNGKLLGKGQRHDAKCFVITAISASVDSQKEVDNDIDEIANKA